MKQLKHSELWDTYLQSLKTISSNGNLKASRKLLSHALRDAEAFGELDERLEWFTYNIANDLCADRDYKSADSLYKQLVETKNRILGTQSISWETSVRKARPEAVAIKDHNRFLNHENSSKQIGFICILETLMKKGIATTMRLIAYR